MYHTLNQINQILRLNTTGAGGGGSLPLEPYQMLEIECQNGGKGPQIIMIRGQAVGLYVKREVI